MIPPRWFPALLLAGLLAVLGAPAARAQAPRTHTVQQWETLYRISLKYGLSVEELRRLNRLAGTQIEVGQVLLVQPGEAARREEPAPAALPVPADTSGAAVGADEGAHATYLVGPGETFYSLAARGGTKASLLHALNQEAPAVLEPGQAIRVPASAVALLASGPVPSGGTAYRVRRGDTVASIARHFGVGVALLRLANSLRTTEIRPGQVLRIPGAGGAETSAAGERLPPVQASGMALVYPAAFAGRPTASGRSYDPEGFSASHRDLPFGTLLLIENPATGRRTFAEVIDRGPDDRALLMNLSAAAARQLGLDPARPQPVTVRLVE
jgi:LysM repeat protein